MICRLWRGWTTTGNAGAYERIVRGEVIPGIEARRIPGFRSIDLVRRERDVEFMTLMWFDTLDNVKEFTGEDYEAAHMPTQVRAVLTGFYSGGRMISSVVTTPPMLTYCSGSSRRGSCRY